MSDFGTEQATSGGFHSDLLQMDRGITHSMREILASLRAMRESLPVCLSVVLLDAVGLTENQQMTIGFNPKEYAPDP